MATYSNEKPKEEVVSNEKVRKGNEEVMRLRKELDDQWAIIDHERKICICEFHLVDTRADMNGTRVYWCSKCGKTEEH